MASSRIVTVDISRFSQKIKASTDAIQHGAEAGIRAAALGAENFAKNRIEVTGTKGSAARFRGDYENYGPGNSPGRNNTGLMKDSVTSETKVSDNGVTGRFGWLKVYKDYFGFQENGFKNRMAYSAKTKSFIMRKGGNYSMVRGMYAIRDAGKLLQQTGSGLVAANIRKELKKIK